jgi:hypothetical protein
MGFENHKPLELHPNVGHDHVSHAQSEVNSHRAAGNQKHDRVAQKAHKPDAHHLDMSDPYAKSDSGKSHSGFPGSDNATASVNEAKPQMSDSKPQTAANTQEEQKPLSNRDTTSDINQNYSVRYPFSKAFGPGSMDSLENVDQSAVPMS